MDDLCIMIRKNILDMALESNEGHVPSSFSIVEILVAIVEHQLHTEGAFRFDHVVLSKGHATYAWYGLLRATGNFSDNEFSSVGKVGSKFYGHLPYLDEDPRFSFGSGSLGHGLPFAVGRALGNHLRGDASPFFVIVGDGEANEGTFWESLLLLTKFSITCKLNLKVLIDANQSSERAIPIMSFLDRLGELTRFDFFTVDGHSVTDIRQAIDARDSNISLIKCNTMKGYPSKELMSPKWHHKAINRAEYTHLIENLVAN
jgi:transketolase